MKKYYIIGLVLILLSINLSGCIGGNSVVGSWNNRYSTLTFSKDKIYHTSYGERNEDDYTFDGKYLEYDTYTKSLGITHCKVEVEFIDSNTMRLEWIQPTIINYELYNGIWDRK